MVDCRGARTVEHGKTAVTWLSLGHLLGFIKYQYYREWWESSVSCTFGCFFESSGTLKGLTQQQQHHRYLIWYHKESIEA